MASRDAPAPVRTNQHAARSTWRSTDGGCRTPRVRIVRGFPRRVEISSAAFVNHIVYQIALDVYRILRDWRAHRDTSDAS